MTTQKTSEYVEKKLWGQLWEWFRPDKHLLILLIVIMVINVGIAVSGPLFLQAALDHIEKGTEMEQIEETVLLLAGIFFLSLILNFLTQVIQNLFIAVINPRFIHRLRKDAYSKIIRNQISFFDQSETGRIVSRITNDSNELLDSSKRFAEAFSQIVIFITVLLVMLYFNIILTLAAIVLTPIIFIIVFLIRKYQRRIAKRWRRNISTVNARFGEVMGSIAISKSFGREIENSLQFHDINEATYQAAKIRGIAIFVVGPIQDFLKTLGLIVLLFVATFQFTEGYSSIAMIYLFVLLQNYLYEPITVIARSYNRFQSSFAALERIIDIMADKETSEDIGRGIKTDSIEGTISFHNLTFEYEPDSPVLRNLTFEIEAGETIAIVGHTGAGKSTLVNLLMRFYNYKKGQIMIDGLGIRDYDLQSLRNLIGYVAQDVLLFSGTIKDNLKIAKPNATEEEMWEAIDTVQAREFLEMLPDGLETQIQEGGKNLSQGQKQMLSLARALISNPRILILDEFTASLDMYTETKIQEGIKSLLKNRTSIVIAHRLTTILDSDRIFVLDHGELIEEGTHEELIDMKGSYADIYNKYFAFQMGGLIPLERKRNA